jgi:hypothetical protein
MVYALKFRKGNNGNALRNISLHLFVFQEKNKVLALIDSIESLIGTSNKPFHSAVCYRLKYLK